jgi:hypothetical protein
MGIMVIFCTPASVTIVSQGLSVDWSAAVLGWGRGQWDLPLVLMPDRRAKDLTVPQ